MSAKKDNLFIAGNFEKNFHKRKFEYDSFMPSLINRNIELKNKKLYLLSEEAGICLGELKAYSKLVPDIDFFIGMYVIKEASKSSRIEGTQTEVDEIVLPEKEISPERRNDWEEVQNYIHAINFAIEKLEKLPLSMRLLNATHKLLLKGTRGQEKQPGEIRKSQNWIGGTSVNNAVFVSPNYNELPELLSDLEKFWHNDDLEIPKIIKIAISHYQFETIHPYLDGNGRIGRLLITLQLVFYKILNKPTLYLSDYFEEKKDEYYDSLNLTRTSNDIEQWISFFLIGVIDTSTRGIETLEKIVDLRRKYEDKILTFGTRAKLGQKLLVYMFSNPVVSISDVSEELGIVYNTARGLMNLFEQSRIVLKVKKTTRTQLFALYEYMDLFL